MVVRYDGGLGGDRKRQMGENELEAIATTRAYLNVQRVYAIKDRDGDNVFEYARKMVNGANMTDGLYCPQSQNSDKSRSA